MQVTVATPRFEFHTNRREQRRMKLLFVFGHSTSPRPTSNSHRPQKYFLLVINRKQIAGINSEKNLQRFPHGISRFIVMVVEVYLFIVNERKRIGLIGWVSKFFISILQGSR